MAATINERFFDFQIAQQIKWIRLQNRDAQEALAILNRVDAQLDATLRKAGIGDAPYTLARLEALKAQVTNLITAVHTEAGAVMTENMKEAAVASGQIEHDLFQKHLPAGLDVTTPNLGVLQAAATLRPFNGAVMADWVNQLETADLKRTWNHILDGITSGTTTDDLIRGLIGTKSLNYKDGVREVSRRGMEALVRTSINHATNQGRQIVWEDNSDILKGIRWCSTLDGRTTPICQSRDGKVGPVTQMDGWTPPEGSEALDPPMARPPAHPNCRSTTCAVTKSWKELGFNVKDMPAGTRASMDGQVPADMTYFQWLATKDEAFQKSVLGKTRYDLWKEKGIQPDRFINDKGELLTIKQLKKDLPVAFSGPRLDIEGVVANLEPYKPIPGAKTGVLNYKIPARAAQAVRSIDFDVLQKAKLGGEFEVRTIDPRTLLSTQPEIDPRAVADLMRLGSKRIDEMDVLPLVLDTKDGLVLLDGNHRANAQALLGSDMRVRVLNGRTTQGKVIESPTAPIPDLSSYETAYPMTADFLADATNIRFLDPAEYGVEKWPSAAELRAANSITMSSAMSRLRRYMVYKVEDPADAQRGLDQFRELFKERLGFNIFKKSAEELRPEGKLVGWDKIPGFENLTDSERVRLSKYAPNADELLNAVIGTDKYTRATLSLRSGPRIEIDAKGGSSVERIQRTIRLDQKTVDHAYFAMLEGKQGAGVAKTILKDAVEFYVKMDINTVEVHANIDVGGYAWVKYGFLQTKSDWDGMRSVLKSKLERKLGMRSLLEPDEQQAWDDVSEILDNGDPKAMWLLADSKLTIGGQLVGKKMLLGSNWYGSLNLKDPESLARFRAYVGN